MTATGVLKRGMARQGRQLALTEGLSRYMPISVGIGRGYQHIPVQSEPSRPSGRLHNSLPAIKRRVSTTKGKDEG